MQFVNSPFWLRFVFPKIVWSMPSHKRSIYLTFDDGPYPEITTAVLDELKKINAKATFFCVGKNVELYPAIVDRILSEGHKIGNHTNTHLNGYKTKSDIYFQDIERCNALTKSNLFRPPYGKLTFGQYQYLKNRYKIVLWSTLSYDFDKNTSPEKCLKNVLKNTKNGSVLVFHDSEKAKNNLLFTLPRVLEHYSKQGFLFEAIT